VCKNRANLVKFGEKSENILKTFGSFTMKVLYSGLVSNVKQNFRIKASFFLKAQTSSARAHSRSSGARTRLDLKW
jgi:hypothetical protein